MKFETIVMLYIILKSNETIVDLNVYHYDVLIILFSVFEKCNKKVKLNVYLSNNDNIFLLNKTIKKK